MLTLEEIRQMDLAQLNKEVLKLKQELLKMKLSTSAAQSKETHKLKELRRQIAWIETVKTELSKAAK